MKRLPLFMLAGLLLVLSGCLYPEDKLTQNQMPNQVQLESVQNAVEKFKKETGGLVPIPNRPMDTPIFLKYPIDFLRLKEYNLMPEPPGNAFERGGPYQYVIVNPEEKPLVKLIDLRLTDKLRELDSRLNVYRGKNTYPPFGERIAPEVFQLDYKKLGLKQQPVVRSPYTGNNLPIIMNNEGKLYIDYSADLYDALKTYEHHYKPGDDIRYLLVEHYPFVPAYSLPYTINQDGEPVFLTK